MWVGSIHGLGSLGSGRVGLGWVQLLNLQ